MRKNFSSDKSSYYGKKEEVNNNNRYEEKQEEIGIYKFGLSTFHTRIRRLSLYNERK